MAFDFKKEYREYYLPKNRPEIIDIPSFKAVAVEGKGNPNDKDGAYQKAIIGRALVAGRYAGH